MMGRVTCADLAELRSAFLDGALREPERDRVLTHLAGCDSCRAEVDELRGVRSLLTRRFAGPEPQDLSDRLLTIPTAARTSGRRIRVAGRSGPRSRGSRLPGSRGGVRRRVTALVVALGLTAIAVTGLGLAAAPERALADVTDPGREGASEFADAGGQLPLRSLVGSVLALVPADQVSAAPRSRPSRQVSGPDLSAAAIQALLIQVSRADQDTSFSGRQIYYADRGTDRVSASLSITNQPDVGTRIVAYDHDGNRLGEHLQPAEATSRITDTAGASLVTRGYTLAAHATADLLGRATVLLEASTRTADPTAATVAARWWIDEATGLVLWQETYDVDEDLVLSTGFTELQLGEATADRRPLAQAGDQTPVDPSPDTRANASLTLSRAGDLASAGWACSNQLAGLSLVRLRSDGASSPGVVHMVYSDGVTTVSVIEQRGRLAPGQNPSSWDDALHAYVVRGALTSASWQSGESVVTVVTDAPDATLHSVVTALPHEPLRSPSTMERVVAGWARILGRS